MRGSSLSNSTVVEALQPFVVCAWNGRSQEDMPKDVKDVLAADRDGKRNSNVLMCVLDAEGKLVRSFSAPQPPEFRFSPDRMARQVRQDIEEAGKHLKLPKVKKKRKTLTLPDVEGKSQPAGVRIFVSFADNRLHQFRAPVVEAVTVSDAERKALQYGKTRDVQAETLRRWLEQIYPPAIMDGMGGFKEISGKLRYQPAGADKSFRFAILAGDVRFVLDDKAGTEYSGKLEIVLQYPPSDNNPQALHGALEATFARVDRQGRPVEHVKMTVAIESLGK